MHRHAHATRLPLMNTRTRHFTGNRGFSAHSPRRCQSSSAPRPTRSARSSWRGSTSDELEDLAWSGCVVRAWTIVLLRCAGRVFHRIVVVTLELLVDQPNLLLPLGVVDLHRLVMLWAGRLAKLQPVHGRWVALAQLRAPPLVTSRISFSHA